MQSIFIFISVAALVFIHGQFGDRIKVTVGDPGFTETTESYNRTESEVSRQLFHGTYTEVYPVEGRKRFNFVDDIHLWTTERDREFESEFEYRITSDGFLELKALFTDYSSTSRHRIVYTDNNAFEIENVTAFTPEFEGSRFIYLQKDE